MKLTQLRKELKSYDKEKLVEKLNEFQRKLFSLNLNSATTHIKDYSQFKKERKNIARALTYLHQKIAKSGN